MSRTPDASLLSSRKLRLGGFLFGAAVITMVGHGLSLRAQESEQLRQWTETRAMPAVALVKPARSAASASIELPGRLEAYTQAPLFARVSGYLKSWKADIGAPVKAGQLLAEIETPELDQQVLQAKADLATAQADATLASSTARRWRMLLDTDSAAKQEVDEKIAAAAAKEAALKSARANVDRYVSLKAFARLTAPFDGVVTSRNTDVGALITAGEGNGQALFTVASVKKLRVYVSVPQAFAPQVHAGTRATLIVPERPGFTYGAEVAATSRAVDAASGASLVQLLVDNAAGELLPGGYVGVRLNLPASAAALSIPASALVMNAQGAHVAVLDADNRVALKAVGIARDLGKTVEVIDGVTAEDRIVDNPPDGIVSGDQVRIASTESGNAG